MDIQSIYKRKSGFVTREVGNELVLVPLSGNVAQMNELFTMNETGRFIWENIGEKTTVEDLEKLLVEAFEVDENLAKKDVELFLKRVLVMVSA